MCVSQETGARDSDQHSAGRSYGTNDGRPWEGGPRAVSEGAGGGSTELGVGSPKGRWVLKALNSQVLEVGRAEHPSRQAS